MARGRAEAERGAVTGEALQQRRGRGGCRGRGWVRVTRVLEVPAPASAQKVAVHESRLVTTQTTPT